MEALFRGFHWDSSRPDDIHVHLRSPFAGADYDMGLVIAL